MSKFYCPACGEESEIQEMIIKPGIELEIRCPNCDMLWDIQIEFYEVEDND